MTEKSVSDQNARFVKPKVHISPLLVKEVKEFAGKVNIQIKSNLFPYTPMIFRLDGGVEEAWGRG